ncbi:ATP-binding protein [Corynebacterium sp. Marseille-P4321]|uniref:ATP-binding protein n=1 Tax=Corynebacterium sp. Marseille-P4321 TaxID=2736603 RepID=UPI00158B6050|nr:ATP-binding protein [Corynebacterium sp. Marseille-P4321]
MENPFRPTFGASPRVWAGRDVILSEFARALDGGAGNPDRSMLISGSRGIGKTVLLNEIEDIAVARGWVVLRASAREQIAGTLIRATIPEAVQRLSQPARREITGFSIAGIGSISTAVDTTHAEPRLTSALRELIALTRESGVLITIDEVQDASADDLAQIAIAYQDLVRDDLPVAVAMAGITQGINTLLDLPGATFLRRARHYELGPLTVEDARLALEKTAEEGSLTFDAAEEAAMFSQGYPYLVQLTGFLAWDAATEHGVDFVDATLLQQVIPTAIDRLGQQVHQPSVRGVPQRQLEYLRAMAALAESSTDGTVRVADIAETLRKSTTHLSDTRSKLIERDLILPAGWGKVEFAQPYLGEYLLRQDRPRRVN